MGDVYIFEDVGFQGKYVRLPAGDYTEDKIRVMATLNLDGTMSSMRVEEGCVVEALFDNAPTKIIVGPEEIENLMLIGMARAINLRVRNFDQKPPAECHGDVECADGSRQLVQPYTPTPVHIRRLSLSPYTLAILYDGSGQDRMAAVMGPRVLDDVTVLGLPSDQPHTLSIHGLTMPAAESAPMNDQSTPAKTPNESKLREYDQSIEYSWSEHPADQPNEGPNGAPSEHPELKEPTKTPPHGVYDGVRKVEPPRKCKKIGFFTMALFLLTLFVFVAMLLYFNYYKKVESNDNLEETTAQ